MAKNFLTDTLTPSKCLLAILLVHFGNFYPYGTVVVKVHSLIVNPKQRVIKFITSFSKEFFILLPCANCFIILKDITDSINQIIVLEKLNIVLKRIRN